MTTPSLQSLPTEILVEILSYLSFDDVALLRQTCRGLDRAARCALNRGFLRSQRCVQTALKRIRAQLPRRESARHRHPMGRRVEHLSAIDTRLSLLDITYTRYINSGSCCFIPGKVLDELFRVFNQLLSNEVVEDSTFALLRELRDISSMAMEHFNEQIAPKLRSQKILQSPSSASMVHHINEPRSLLCSPGSVDLSSRPLGRSSGLLHVLSAAAAVLTGSSTPHSRRDSQPTVPDTPQLRPTPAEFNQLVTSLSDRVTAQQKTIGCLSRRVLRLERALTLRQNRRRSIQQLCRRRRLQRTSSQPSDSGASDKSSEFEPQPVNEGENRDLPMKRRRL